MALRLVNPGIQPLGQFDGKDSEFLTLKGGEVVTFTSVAPGADAGASDAADGYQNNGHRPVVTRTLVDGNRPLMLADDGTSGYGTLFGTVVGGTVGTAAGVVLGPHSATGSGKVTLWDKPGMYAVTLDAVASSLAPTATGITAGSPLYASSDGLLTANSGDAFEKSGGDGLVVGNFVSFETDRTLVTTPNRLVAAAGTAAANKFTVAVFHFSPDGNRYV